MTRSVVAYIRFSREDVSQSGTMEEKIANRSAQCYDLAQRHGLTLHRDNILLELESGGSIEKRPIFQHLLQMCESGAVSHLITPYQDRLLRGDLFDQAMVQDALLDGRVILITNEGVTAFDESYEATDEMQFGMKSLMARFYRQDAIRKLKAANRQRHKLGQRSSGLAPYGYFWVKRTATTAGHYEIVGDLALTNAPLALSYATENAPHCLNGETLNTGEYLALARRKGLPDGSLLPGVTCTGGEYATLCEFFERLRTESLNRICVDFNARGIPPPSATRRKTVAPAWNISTLHTIANKPTYAGFPAHRWINDRKGNTHALPREQWVMPDSPIDAPHPLTFEEWEEILKRMEERNTTGNTRTKTRALLSGVLRCSRGQPMRLCGRVYMCACEKHPFNCIGQAWTEREVVNLLETIVNALPDAPVSSGRTSLPQAPQNATERALRAKEEQYQSTFKLRSVFEASGNLSALESTLTTLQTEIDALRAQRDAERAEHAEARGQQTLGMLCDLRDWGFRTLWESDADMMLRREIVKSILVSLTVIEPANGRSKITGLRIQLHAWIAPFYTQETLTHTQSRPR